MYSNAFGIYESPSEEDTGPLFLNSVQYSILRGIHAKNIIKDVFWSSESELGTDD